MAIRDRHLIAWKPGADPVRLAERYNRYFAKHPEALQYSEEAAAEFLLVCAAIDDGSTSSLISQMRHGGIRVPSHLSTDRYRIGRFLVRRWPDGAAWGKLVYAINLDPKRLQVRTARAGDVAALAALLEFEIWPLVLVWSLRQAGQQQLIPAYKEALSPVRREWYAANLAQARYLMHRCLDDRDDRQPTPAEQRQIIQRIRRRDLQLQSIRRSLYGLSQERKALATRLRHTDQAGRAELNGLLTQLDRLQVALAEAERTHAAALAARTEAYQRQAAELEAAIGAAQADFAAALAERNQWAPAAMLDGLTVAVVGDDAREAGYRALVESAGGRLIHVSAVEKLSRVPEAVATADLVIVMTAVAKHQAEHRLRKAAPPGTLVLRCAKAGLGAFERLVRTEALPRLALQQAAPTTPPGGE